METRDFSATLMAVDSSQVEKVRELAEEFRLKSIPSCKSGQRKMLFIAFQYNILTLE